MGKDNKENSPWKEMLDKLSNIFDNFIKTMTGQIYKEKAHHLKGDISTAMTNYQTGVSKSLNALKGVLNKAEKFLQKWTVRSGDKATIKNLFVEANALIHSDKLSSLLKSPLGDVGQANSDLKEIEAFVQEHGDHQSVQGLERDLHDEGNHMIIIEKINDKLKGLETKGTLAEAKHVSNFAARVFRVADEKTTLYGATSSSLPAMQVRNRAHVLVNIKTAENKDSIQGPPSVTPSKKDTPGNKR